MKFLGGNVSYCLFCFVKEVGGWSIKIVFYKYVYIIKDDGGIGMENK